MQIPNLPTDNLYKFMALSGLFILIISIYVPSYYKYELKIAMIKAQNLSGKQEIKVANLKRIVEKIKTINPAISEMKEMSEEVNDTLEEYRDPKYRASLEIAEEAHAKIKRLQRKHNEKIKIFEEKSSSHANELENFQTLSQKIKLARLDIEEKTKVIELQLDSLSQLFLIQVFLIVLSIPLILFGFFLWYYSVQKPMDDKLQKDLQDS